LGAQLGKQVFNERFVSPVASSDAVILALQPKEKPYKQSFGEGLFILVHPDGKKYWRLKYRFGGRELSYSIGVFPDVSFSAAMAAKKAARNLLCEGIDPNAVKRELAKSKPKTASDKVFQLSLSAKGALTIETKTKLVMLTASQTKALRSFLGVEFGLNGSGDDA
jgi:hypothetical protein